MNMQAHAGWEVERESDSTDRLEHAWSRKHCLHLLLFVSSCTMHGGGGAFITKTPKVHLYMCVCFLDCVSGEFRTLSLSWDSCVSFNRRAQGAAWRTSLK